MILPHDKIVDLPELRDKLFVFRDRDHAGEILATMLINFKETNAVVLAIPAGGVPVGDVVADKLNLPINVAVVSKITLPWNTEVGYGAVAFDGTVSINENLVKQVGLEKSEIKKGIEETLKKVNSRAKKFFMDKNPLNVDDRTVILVDDGVASGFTVLVAVEALKNLNCGEIILSVPTGSLDRLISIESKVNKIYCPNVRRRGLFAVADAYQYWSDVSEDEVINILKKRG
ncbi:MAG: phosphoribosyltransferase [Methanomicrobiales archaeon]